MRSSNPLKTDNIRISAEAPIAIPNIEIPVIILIALMVFCQKDTLVLF
ncbi:MAG: hypothetical protein IPH57_09655 [Saprospiraceae bacterium]|nr:hypothetical protein [Saprospiraceae bacterium]